MRPQNKQTPHNKPSAVKCRSCQAVSRLQRKRALPLQLARRCRVEESCSWLSFLRKRGPSIIAHWLQSPIWNLRSEIRRRVAQLGRAPKWERSPLLRGQIFFDPGDQLGNIDWLGERGMPLDAKASVCLRFRD